MGVSGLTQLMHNREEIPAGVFCVHIIDEIQKFKTLFNKDPLIIFDFSPLQHIQNDRPMELLCGSRWRLTITKIKNLMEAMTDACAKIVFFLEAPTQEEQEKSWLARKTNQYRDFCEVVNKIKDGNFYLSHNQRTSPVVLGPYLRQELKNYGTWFKAFDTDVDLAIAKYANENNALAIFTDDSDFLIYEGFYRLWKIREINFKTFTTKELSRTKLRRSLNLKFYQMPLFSTLCGNDVLQRSEVEPLHDKRPEGMTKFRWIATLTKEYQPRQEMNKREIEMIAQMIGCCAETVSLSLRQYDLSYEPQKHLEKNPFLRELQNHDQQTLYIILKGFTNRIGPMYEDVGNVTFKRSQTQLSLYLYRCTMGILLQHKNKKGVDEVFCPIYTVKDHDVGYERFKETPIYPKLPVPPLKELIFRQNDEKLDAIRFRLLKWAIKCPKLNIEKLVLIEPVFVPVVLTLCFLVKVAKMSVEGADMFLLCFYDAIHNLIPDVLELPAPETFHFRTFQACWMYIQVQNGIMELLSSLGLHKFAVYSAFDGVYFHDVCNLWATIDDKMKDEFLSEIQNMRLYKNL